MKQTEVKIGEIYLTRVGADLARVRVTGEAPPRWRPGGGGLVRFFVVRADGRRTTIAPRTAAALRALPPTLCQIGISAVALGISASYEQAPMIGTDYERFTVRAPLVALPALRTLHEDLVQRGIKVGAMRIGIGKSGTSAEGTASLTIVERRV